MNNKFPVIANSSEIISAARKAGDVLRYIRPELAQKLITVDLDDNKDSDIVATLDALPEGTILCVLTGGQPGFGASYNREDDVWKLEIFRTVSGETTFVSANGDDSNAVSYETRRKDDTRTNVGERAMFVVGFV